ncbi:hypothetical protein [Xanthomonas cerealis]|nr:hypothetical protein [Xanthomonas translucens]
MVASELLTLGRRSATAVKEIAGLGDSDAAAFRSGQPTARR